MAAPDFLVVGSSGGGGTIAWLLAKAGFHVLVLEQGPDIAEDLDRHDLQFNGVTHDEHRFRLGRPTEHRHPRGDYNTFRQGEGTPAKPFPGAWTGSLLGGGSIIWGTWSFRALPIDFRLREHFAVNGQLTQLESEGYSIPDWPVTYAEIEPFYNVAETLLAVSGDRRAINESIRNSAWFGEFSSQQHFASAGNWEPTFPFPCPPYSRTPVGQFLYDGMEKAGMNPVPLPSGIVAPGSPSYSTRAAIRDALSAWSGKRPSFWKRAANEIWSERVRDACNMCGFCGEFLCWGKRGPKSSSRVSTIRELQDLPNAEVRTNAKVFEVTYDAASKRATGVRYLDISEPDHPRPHVQRAKHVVVACGAVQSARLLFLSGPPEGMGNSHGQLGRYATFHLFGFSAQCTLPERFQGHLHAELGHTGNTASFAPYFVKDDAPGSPTAGKWWKAGTLASTAKKNPLDNTEGLVGRRNLIGRELLTAMERYPRSVELRLTGDDLPMARNRVDLDPTYVDEYGIPVARVTRDFGPAELRMFALMRPQLKRVFAHYLDTGVLTNLDDPNQLEIKEKAVVDLIGDHQMGTCRMGNDPKQSVIDRFCRLHDAKNVFVVDSSFMPTGLGLNPMVTVVANALRVGTWIVEEAKKGKGVG